MVIVFDINGTLLDTRAVQPELRSIFGRKLNAEQFFTRTLQYSMTLSLVGTYSPLSDIALAVLKMEADGHKVRLSEAGTKRVGAALKSMPPFREVPGSLGKLRKAGFRLAVLTNSAGEDARAQLANAKLTGYFEHISPSLVSAGSNPHGRRMTLPLTQWASNRTRC